MAFVDGRARPEFPVEMDAVAVVPGGVSAGAGRWEPKEGAG